MVEKIYYIEVARNTKSEGQYIRNTYNTNRCGVYAGRILQARLDFADQDAENIFIEDMAKRGVINMKINETFVDMTLYAKSVKDNKLMFSIVQQINLNALSTNFVDVFPALYLGIPIPVDTTGYKKMGMVVLWNKNGGTGTHTLRLVKCGFDGILSNPLHIFREGPIPNGYFADFNFTIPAEFIDYIGGLKLQAKSSNGTDNPIFNGLYIYMIRR